MVMAVVFDAVVEVKLSEDWKFFLNYWLDDAGQEIKRAKPIGVVGGDHAR